MFCLQVEISEEEEEIVDTTEAESKSRVAKPKADYMDMLDEAALESTTSWIERRRAKRAAQAAEMGMGPVALF